MRTEVVECAEAIVDEVIRDFTVQECKDGVNTVASQDTLNAVACLVDACWSTEGMQADNPQDVCGHVGQFGIPAVRLVRINAGHNDHIPAHVLVAVCDLLIRHHAIERDNRRQAMAERMAFLRQRREEKSNKVVNPAE